MKEELMAAATPDGDLVSRIRRAYDDGVVSEAAGAWHIASALDLDTARVSVDEVLEAATAARRQRHAAS